MAIQVLIDKSFDLATSFSSRVSFARPNDTTAYTAVDVVGPADGSTIEFKNIGLANQRVLITSISLEVDAATVIASEAAYTLYLYNRLPGALADNAAWDIPAADRDAFIGFVTLGTPVDLGSTLYVETNIVNKQIQMSGSSSLWGYLTTAGAYTPTASRVFVIKLHAVLV